MNHVPYGGAADLAPLRQMLAAADFTAASVCRRLGISSIYDFRSIREGRQQGTETHDTLDLLVRLFMDVELVDRESVNRLLGSDGSGLLESLGLLTSYQPDNQLCHAAVLLYPAEWLWIISDLNVSPAGPAQTALAEDAVYPAITRNTRQFLSSLPQTPCDAFLELCSGTGIAALLASKYARHSWAADITERATRFARFNAALNGIENCTAVQGDLYDAVGGQRFDRIVAHPPYMPSLEQKYIFRDGGEDGEQITRRIIAGLPEHLRPGGRFYCTCMLTDRKESRAEDRIRRMLGENAEEFDVAVMTLQAFDPTEYYFRLALAGRATVEEAQRRHEIFGRLEVERLVYCSTVIQRRSGRRATFTSRRQAGSATGVGEIEWLLGWEAEAAAPEAIERILTSQPMASPDARLRVTQVLRAGEWVAEDCVLATAAPFALEAKCPTWIGALIGAADGSRTTRELLGLLKDAGSVPPDAPETEFAKLVRSLIGGGFLQLADFPLPGNGGARLFPPS